MKYIVANCNEIDWVRNYTEYDGINDEMGLLMRKKKFDELCEHFCDEDGNCDMDALYDALRLESDETLAMVGLHLVQETASVEEILAAWEKSTGRKVLRENGEACGLEIDEFHDGDHLLEFESLDEDGEVETVELWDDEILKLVDTNGMHPHGAFNGYDPKTAEFEMW